MADTKPWYLSKTIWINCLTLAATMIGDMSGQLPEGWSQYSVAALAIVNVALRFITSLPVTAFLLALLFSVNTDVQAGDPPVGASVRMVNGSVSQCSGTVFSKGEHHAVAVGAAHCFAGRVGGEFDVRVAGKEAKATLIAHDAARDLALWKLPASVVSEVALFPDEQPQGPLTAIGYPQRTLTAEVKKLKYRDQYDEGGRFQWRCEVLEGKLQGGDSGGGVFMDGKLAGVIHGMETRSQGCETGQCRLVTYLHAVCYSDVRAFVNAHKDKWADCVTPTGGKAVPPPPMDLANVAPPKDGTFPDRESTQIILALLKRVEALEKSLADLPKAPAVPGLKGDTGPQGEPGTAGKAGSAGPAGPAGPAGKDGRDGTDGKDGSPGRQGTVTVILIGPDGKEISRASDVVSGSVAKLNVKQVLKGGQ